MCNIEVNELSKALFKRLHRDGDKIDNLSYTIDYVTLWLRNKGYFITQIWQNSERPEWPKFHILDVNKSCNIYSWQSYTGQDYADKKPLLDAIETCLLEIYMLEQKKLHAFEYPNMADKDNNGNAGKQP